MGSPTEQCRVSPLSLSLVYAPQVGGGGGWETWEVADVWDVWFSAPFVVEVLEEQVVQSRRVRDDSVARLQLQVAACLYLFKRMRCVLFITRP